MTEKRLTQTQARLAMTAKTPLVKKWILALTPFFRHCEPCTARRGNPQAAKTQKHKTRILGFSLKPPSQPTTILGIAVLLVGLFVDFGVELD